MKRTWILTLATLMIAGCSAAGSESGSNPGGGAGGGGGSGTDGGMLDGAPLDVVTGDVINTVVGHLRGRVVAPEGTIPISGALVYLSDAKPDPIPDKVYCDKCVELSTTDNYTTTGPDGQFDLPATSVGPRYLIVQKGQFRRVRPMTVVEGDQDVPLDMTTLPGKMDKANGDDIPRMAVIQGQWDAIEVSLAKLGLAQLSTGAWGETTVDPNTASFDLWTNRVPLSDASVISNYHIVFIPCSGSSGTTCDDSTAGESDVQKVVQDFVAAGGKLYVTDYSYEFVRQPFPDYVQWEDEGGALGSACQSSSYDAPAVVNDTDMKAWLEAQGIQHFEVEANWTTVSGVSPVNTVDMDGKPVTVTPKVWVDGQKSYGLRPTTVSFEQSCGRVLFSTYHTEATGESTLLPQEKALLYVLLEVGVCLGTPQVN